MKALLSQITKLRQDTGAGVMAVKKALEEAKGDSAKAKEILKKQGLAMVLKKAERETSVGRVEAYMHHDGRVGALVKITCETDFVARNSEFIKLCREVCLQVASMNPKNIDQLLGQEYIREPEKTVKDLVNEAIAKLGENIKIAEFARIEI